MAGFRSNSENDVFAEINVVPLVDVVLVLLVIFMLTAPLLQRMVDVQLPRSQTASTAQEERIVLSITGKGIVYFDKYPVDWEQLETYIRTQAPGWKDRAVYIRADAKVSYERVVQLLDLLRRYGIHKVGLVTRPWVES